jgi:hypothetical protein
LENLISGLKSKLKLFYLKRENEAEAMFILPAGAAGPGGTG